MVCVFGCGPAGNSVSERAASLHRIDSLEAAYFETKATMGNPKTGMGLVREYARFYQADGRDSLATDMLFKAGEVSMGIGQGHLAVKYFKLISGDHPEFEEAAEALFLCGFCSENLNADTAEARFYYEAFLKQFPEHHLVKDAQFSLLNMGRSDAELIEMFEEKLARE